jgi:exopolysaccharide production protein ExoZ
MNRIESLDWQRGLLAFAIMFYPLTGWQLHELDSSSLLGRLGIYGVSMFFVLSGLSMAIVYHRYIDGVRSSASFFIRRVFRIWPLLWLAVAFSVAAGLAAHKSPDWYVVAMNLTTAFGFVDPSLYISTGAWSIGNEMVYYALTPFII